jgi:F0F1-type ATP synthase membrane subunit b/b'
MRGLSTVPFALLLLAPATALASGGGFAWETNGVYIAVFLVVMVPVVWFAAPVVRGWFTDRRARVKADLDEAQAAFDTADARLKAAEARLAGIQAEVAALAAEFRRMGEAERDSLAREGEALTAKIREETSFRLKQAARSARAELTDELVDRALGQVERRLDAGARGPVSEAVVDRVIEGLR